MLIFILHSYVESMNSFQVFLSLRNEAEHLNLEPTTATRVATASDSGFCVRDVCVRVIACQQPPLSPTLSDCLHFGFVWEKFGSIPPLLDFFFLSFFLYSFFTQLVVCFLSLSLYLPLVFSPSISPTCEFHTRRKGGGEREEEEEPEEGEKGGPIGRVQPLSRGYSTRSKWHTPDGGGGQHGTCGASVRKQRTGRRGMGTAAPPCVYGCVAGGCRAGRNPCRI